MKKLLFMAASAALALSSCSNEEVVQGTDTPVEGQTPVAFVPYLTTRATDVLDNGTDGLQKRGFGVFAYEQDTKPFSAYYPTALKPNFMYNQAVHTAAWTYEPVKYYSNNVGAKHSFFAYAPFAKTQVGTGDYLFSGAANAPELVLQGVNNGPALHYAMPANLDEAIDLCWGEYNNTGHAAIDLEKQGIDHKINFTFHHALSRISFNAQLWIDEVRPDLPHYESGSEDGTEGTPDNTFNIAETTITIKSLKLVGTMATEGTLRLYDGAWDAQIATSQALEMNPYFETPGAFVLSDDKSEQPLFGDNANYLMLIPGGSFQIQIEYEVKTKDIKLPGGYSIVNNNITSEEIFTLNAGQTYEYHLNLGMTSVKFDAEIKPWDADVKPEIDVPVNHYEAVVGAVEVSAAPTPLADFLGEYNAAPTSTKAGEHYYNAVDGKMYKSVASAPNFVWNSTSYAAAGPYLNNHKLYIVGADGATTVQTAPRWIKDTTGNYYLYEGTSYDDKGTAPVTPKATFEATVPSTGMYSVDGTIYYVK